MKISIITPFLNAEDYIEETAKSILNQTFEDFEWIIVDDGSGSKGIEKLKQIERLDKRIKVFFREGGTGPAQTRDFGIEKSSNDAKYVVFLDADDLYERTFLECCYWTLETHLEASWAYTDSINFGAKNFLWRKWYDVEWEKQENILIVSACIRKQDLLEVGGFGLKEKRIYEDWYLWLKLIKAGKYPIRINALLTYYRQKEGISELKESNTNNKKNALKIIENIRKDIVNYKEGIQFPKYDYNWEYHTGDICEVPFFKKESSKIKVLMIIPWMVTGGADKFNLSLISKMDKSKFDFTIITTLPATNEWRSEFEKYAKVYDLTTFLDMKDWIRFINYIIAKQGINLIFNSNSQFGYKILPYIKAKYPEIPIVDYVHMEEWYWRNGGYSRDSSMVQNVIDKTFTCNENSRKVFINKFNRKKCEVETVYIGVDEKKFDPSIYDKNKILQELNITEKVEINNKFVISFICRITEQKRPYLFFEVIKKLSIQRQDFFVVVAGDGPMLEDFKRKVRENKLDEYFLFLGNFKETGKVYKISDITVNTSIKEGLALTSYESLAMGVPVVSSDVGGQAELINQGAGIIVPCFQNEKEILNFNYSDEEIDYYIDGINQILNNLEFYKSNCRPKILENFTEDKMVKIMEKEFIEIAQNPDKEKINHGKELSKNIDILKELVFTFFVSNRQDYEWLVNEFNKKNVHKKELKKNVNYEKTLEYKVKHPIVVALRKLGMYEKTRKILRME